MRVVIAPGDLVRGCFPLLLAVLVQGCGAVGGEEERKTFAQPGWERECREFEGLPFKMCRIPPGRVQPGGAYSPFDAPRWFEVTEFWLAETVVTNAQYEGFDPDHRKRRDAFSPLDGGPVTGVRWDEAQAYLAWLAGQTGYDLRLPTALEWQHACHGDRAGRFPWGVSAGGGRRYRQLANIGAQQAVPVASYPANDFGLYDMAGNVEEWSQDRLLLGVDGKRLYPEDAGYEPSETDLRVAKNCSAVFENPYYCGCEMFTGGDPEQPSVHRGFRVAML